MIIMKFGGTSVADGERIRGAAGLVFLGGAAAEPDGQRRPNRRSSRVESQHGGSFAMSAMINSEHLALPLFIAWSIKSTILKVGGVQLYRRGSAFFIGPA